MAEQPDAAAHAVAVARPRAGRSRARSPRRDTTGSRPAHVRSSVVLPAPFGPWTSTISPRRTSRSTPARAGNRPSSETAARRWTTWSFATGSMETREATGAPKPQTKAGRCHDRPARARATLYHRRRAAGEGARGDRAHDDHARRADPALRRLPAVGHRHPRGAGAGPAGEAVRPERRLPRRRRRPLDADRSGRTVARRRRPPSTGPGPPRRSRRRRQAPSEGQLLGKIEIPKIGLTRTSSRASRVDDLKNGPGHYPGTPLPGQKGNAAIAGHRTTYGAPFADVDELQAGDQLQSG